MNNVAKNEDEKIKKIKKTSETESYEDYANEAMEDSEEGSTMEEMSLADDNVPSGSSPNDSSIAKGVRESSVEEKCLRDLYEQRKKNLMREKWLSVTGRKPKNVPLVKRYGFEDTETARIVFFGDKRPAEIEKHRKQKWIKIITHEMHKKPQPNLGRLRQEIRIPFLCEGITSVKFERNARTLATACRNGGVQIRKPFTGEVMVNLKSIEWMNKLPVRGMAYHPFDGSKLYVGGAAGMLQVYDVDAATLAGNSEKMEQINNLDISPDGFMIAVGARNGKVYLCDTNNLKIISLKNRPNIDETTTSDLEDKYHKLRVFGVKFHPTKPGIFVTGGWDCSVKVWDVRMPEAILSIRGPLICGDSVDVQDNKILTASWSREDSLKLWDFSSGDLIQNIPIKPSRSTTFEGEFLYAAHFFKEGVGAAPPNQNLVVVAGSGFHEVDIVNINSGKIVASFPSYKAVANVDSIASYIAYGGPESLFRIGEMISPAQGGDTL